MHFPLLQISNSALLLFFIRTKVGKEFQVAGAIGERFDSIEDSPLYYTCYGRYDLLELLMVDSHNLRHYVPVHEHIIETSSALFYCWKGISKPIYEWAKGSPVLVASLLNIHPGLVEKTSLESEIRISKVLQERFGDHANPFLGMGHSEVLLLLKGRNFNDLLNEVTEVVRTMSIRDIGVRYGPNVGYPKETRIFICTTSYPSVAHPALRSNRSYEEFEGTVAPIVYINCAPGLEDYVVAKRPNKSVVRNVYGKYDLAIEWDEPIELATFAKNLTDFRNVIGKKEGVQNTCTIFKSSEDRPTKELGEAKPIHHSIQLSSSPLTRRFLTQSKCLDPVVRGQLLDFLGRFDTYYCRPESHSFFRDMAGLRQTVSTVLSIIPRATAEDRQLAQTYLSQVLDLANHAIYQRYAGIETHFEFDQHVPFPFLCDINGYISASNSVPFFLFSSFFGDKVIEQFWPGFVLFGQSYSYQWLSGHVLSYQASALFRPIEDWWGISHEVAHSIYWLTDFLRKRAARDIQDYISKASSEDPEKNFQIDIAEIFANWFDYKYVFCSNPSSFFPIIWRSWLRWERIWAYGEQYLVRSLATFLSGYLEDFYEARGISRPATEEFLEGKFNQMNEIILNSVPEYSRFIKHVKFQKKSLFNVFIHLIHVLNFLENNYFDQEIYKRMNPNYPSKILQDHVSQIKRGQIITDKIPSPVKLLHELYRACRAPQKEVSLRTTAATALTLWNYYVREVSLWRRK